MKRILCVLVFFVLCFFCQDYAFAQRAAVDIEAESKINARSKPIVVAAVEIYNAQIISQSNNDLTISFEIFNGEKIQPDIKYAVQLIQETDNKEVVADEKVFAETIYLNENQKIKKNIKYSAPVYLRGAFFVQIITKNESGLMLALARPGNINLKGNGQYVEILPGSCYLTVEGENDKKYTLTEGVDISPNEKIIGFCDVVNHFDVEKQFIPKFITFWRSDFGKEVDVKNESQEKIILGAKEKKKVSFVLPRPEIPQAYDSQLKFIDSQNNSISNSVRFHHVIAGSSATIQNFRIDKNFYQKGDVANVSLFWSGTVNSSSFSRIKSSSGDKFFAYIAMKDSYGKNCVDEFRKELVADDLVANFILPVKNDCFNPQMAVSIQDSSGNRLDNKEINVASPNLPPKNNEYSFRKLGIALVGILLIFSLILIFLKRKRIAPLLFFLVFGGMFFFQICLVEAETVTDRYYLMDVTNEGIPYQSYHRVTINYSINKNTFAPGESIVGNFAAVASSCDNSLRDFELYMKFYDSQPWFKVTNTMPFSEISNVPNVPGTYEASFAFRDLRCYEGNDWCPYNQSVYIINKLIQLSETSGQMSRDGWTSLLESQGMTYRDYFDRYSASEGVSGCAFRCGEHTNFHKISYTVDGALPAATPLSCSNSIPPGYTACPGDGTGSSLAWSAVGSAALCTLENSCEYYPSSCSGSIPEDCTACPGDGMGSSLTWERKDNAGECTSRNCEYYSTSCTPSCGVWSQCQPSCGPGGQRRRNCTDSSCNLYIETDSSSCDAVCPISTEWKEVKP